MKSIAILDQIRASKRNPLALFFASLVAILPVSVYYTAHYEILGETNPWILAAKVLAVLAGLTFSAKSVYEWAIQLFGDKAKSLGFVVLLETMMVLSDNLAIARTCLGILVLINVVSAAARIAERDRKQAKKRSQAPKKAAKTKKDATLRAVV